MSLADGLLVAVIRLASGVRPIPPGALPAEPCVFFANHSSHLDFAVIWAALPPKPDGQAALVRSRVDAIGGHAMLLRASEALRRNVDVFHPQTSGLAALSERVRASFDPKGILNRGRMLRGSAA